MRDLICRRWRGAILILIVSLGVVACGASSSLGGRSAWDELISDEEVRSLLPENLMEDGRLSNIARGYSLDGSLVRVDLTIVYLDADPEAIWVVCVEYIDAGASSYCSGQHSGSVVRKGREVRLLVECASESCDYPSGNVIEGFGHDVPTKMQVERYLV